MQMDNSQKMQFFKNLPLILDKFPKVTIFFLMFKVFLEAFTSKNISVFGGRVF